MMRKITIKWLKQAAADLKAAKDSLEDGNYEWGCFQSQLYCGGVRRTQKFAKPVYYGNPEDRYKA